MTLSYHPAAAAAVRHPLHAMLVPFPAVSFTLALLTDIAFWQTSNILWQNFSAWLLFAGLVFGALAALAGVVDYLSRRAVRAQRNVWGRAFGTLVVLALALINSLVHAGDGWTAVVPYGLLLSAATVFVIAVTAYVGRPRIVRDDAGVNLDA